MLDGIRNMIGGNETATRDEREISNSSRSGVNC